jgi:MFS family permease
VTATERAALQGAPVAPDRPDPVRGRAFRRFWAAATISQLGDGVGRIAVPLLAATLTRDPVLIGGLTAAAFLPWLLLGLPSGVLVDRVDRRAAMVLANLFRGVALAALCGALVADVASIWLLYLVVLVLGAAETVYDSAAQAAVPTLVGERDVDLDRANSRLQGAETVAQNFLGAPLAGVLFALVAVLPFGVNAVGFLASALLVASLPRLVPRGYGASSRGGLAASLRSVPGEIVDGVRWLWRHRLLRGLCLVSAGAAFAAQVGQATAVLFVLDELHLDAAWFGAIGVVAAVGALTGSLLAGRLAARFGRGHVMLATLVVEAATLVAIGWARNAVLAAAAWLPLAGGVGVWNVLSMSLRQQLVPSEVFGRVHGAWRTLVWGVLPLGGLVGGVVAAQGGLRAPWFAGGLLDVLLLPAAAVLLTRLDRRDESPVPVSDPGMP